MKILITLILTLLLSSCKQSQLEPGAKRDAETGVTWKSTKLVTLENGCEIHRLLVDGSFMNMAYCPIGPASLSYSCVKSTCLSGTAPMPSAEELAKAAALAKLTPEDRKALGIKNQ